MEETYPDKSAINTDDSLPLSGPGASGGGSQAELFDKIRSFVIDDSEAEFAFADRLARENDWSPDFAERVIEEYRKFMFLAVVAGHPVTPSDQVDQVWHLHLTYSRSYWTRFCGDVLGVPLHHGPTKGGSEEASKFDDWYQNTLDSYERFFGYRPPPDIWPPPSIRFGRDLHFRRVNTNLNWVVPKLSQKVTKALMLAFALVAFVLFLLWTMNPSGDISSAGPDMGFSKASPVSESWLHVDLVPIIIIGIILFIFHFVLYPSSFFESFWLIFGRSCSACKKWRALKTTGATRLMASGTRQMAWRCKYCDHEQWRTKKRSSGGSGGCASSGCGGCGGCGGG